MMKEYKTNSFLCVALDFHRPGTIKTGKSICKRCGNIIWKRAKGWRVYPN